MQRRDILKAGSGALALSGLLLGRAQAQQADAPFAWSRQAADALLGQTFWLNHPERRALALVLGAVTVPEQAQPRLDQFSLVFNSAETGIAAATYEFEHPTAGRFALHLVPAAPGTRNMQYRADFSLLA